MPAIFFARMARSRNRKLSSTLQSVCARQCAFDRARVSWERL